MESTRPTLSPSLPPPSSPNPSPSLVTSDPMSHNLEHLDRAEALTLQADDLGIEARGGISDVSELGVRVLHPEDRSSSTCNSFSNMEPLQSATLPRSEEMPSSASYSLEPPGDATPENCLLALNKLPPLDEVAESGKDCDNTSPKIVDDDVTALKQLTLQAAAADIRQGPPPQGGQTQHRDHTSVSLGPAEEASGCSTSWQDQFEAARLAAYPPHPNPLPLPPGKSFHVFFSYCWKDAVWVRRMVDVLESEHGLRCCYHERDFKPGARVIENINLHIERSVKTALVVTPAFLESEWCSYEAEVVMHLSVDQRRRLLVPVLLQQCQLPGALRPLTYIDATKPAFLDRFLAAILDQDESVHDRPLPLGSTDFFFNPNFYNLDHLCDVSSEKTPCRGETIWSPYLPEVLMNRGLTMTTKEHGDIIDKLTKAFSVPCSCLFDGKFICRLAYMLFSFGSIALLVLGAVTVSMAKDNSTHAGGVVMIVFSLVLPFGLYVPIRVIEHIKGRRLQLAMIEVNGILFRHQMIAGLVLDKYKKSAIQLKVYYFNPRPCQDHLAQLLSSRPVPSTQRSGGTDNQIFEAGGSPQVTKGERSVLGRGQSSASTTEQIEVSIEPPIPREEVEKPKEISPEQDRALKLLLIFSNNYLWNYNRGKLPLCETPRHVRQVPCLCQYVEERTAVV